MAMLPEGWSAHDLGDLAQKIEGGGTPPRNEPSYWDGDIPWASVKDLRGVKLSTTEEFISELGLENSSSKLIPSNTMIIASRMAVGKAVFFNQDVAINQDLKAFYPKENTDGLFLLQWYLSQSEKIESLATGSTVKGIRLDDLTLLPIDLPPLPEQQKIATILSSVDDVIEKTRAQIDKLKDLKTGMMQELLTKGIGHTEFKDSPVGRIPLSWDVVSVGTLTDVIDPQPDHRTPAEVKDGIPYVGLGDIDKSGLINFSAARKVSQEAFEKQKQGFEIYPGAFIFGKIGTIGKPYVLPVERFYCLSANVVLITTNNHMNMKYLFQVFGSGIIDQQVLLQTNTTSQPALGIKKVRDFLVPYSRTPEEVELITEVLTSMDERMSKVNNKLVHQLDLKKALMQDLLTGKMRVKLTDKESAVV